MADELQIGARICEAVGLDPATVNGLTIRVRPGQEVTVTAVHILDFADPITTELRRYVLTEKPNG